MKNITRLLSEEHQNIIKVIKVLLEECNAIEAGKEPDKNYLSNVIEFIKNYADGYHHVKEEDILFKSMLEQFEDMHCNPIPVMLNEHEAGRRFVNGLEEGIANSDVQQILENARGYGYLLQDHIYKEDNVLYPMAEEVLSEEQKTLVLAKYEEVNGGMYAAQDVQKYLDLVSAE